MIVEVAEGRVYGDAERERDRLARILGAGVGRKPSCRAGGPPGSVLVWKARLSEDDSQLQHRELNEAICSATWEAKGSEVD
jgi:hypothetical protein